MDTPRPAVLILAAGRGTRMKSESPKVLHRLLGRPLVEHVLNAALYLNPVKVVLVTGFQAEAVEADVSAFLDDLRGKRGAEAVPEPLFARQTEQLGTGHAVAMARPHLEDFPGPVVIIYGDVPLISPNTLDGLLKAHQALAADLSALTVRLDDPSAYGRIIRDEQGWLKRIVEFRDADEAERLVREINAGLYVAEAARLYEAIERLKPNNDQGEYYLTDVVGVFLSQGGRVVSMLSDTPGEELGVNTPEDLAVCAEALAQRRR